MHVFVSLLPMWDEGGFYGANRYRLAREDMFGSPYVPPADFALRQYVSGDYERLDGVTELEYELDFFMCLTEWLNWAFGWLPQSTDSYLLTGSTPILFPMMFHTAKSSGFGGVSDTPRRDMVAVRVHAFVSPRDLMERYSDIRQRMIGEKSRMRVPSQKRVELALFAARRNDGRTWDSALAEWNSEHSETYADVRSFARDCRAAYRQTTDSDLQWQSAPARGGHAKSSKRGGAEDA